MDLWILVGDPKKRLAVTEAARLPQFNGMGKLKTVCVSDSQIIIGLGT